MASTIRLADGGLPEAPPPGSARLFLEQYNGRLHLKMLRPDGSVEVFGTLNLPLEVENGGTGTTQTPSTGQILIGDGSRYKPGNIVAGRKISVVSTEDQIEISADVQDFSINLRTPPEFFVTRDDSLGASTLFINKIAQLANSVYAGPVNGIDGLPGFRTLVESDIPDLDSTKIRRFEERVRESIATSLLESTEISFNYDEALNKTAFYLNPTGVLPGTYGNSLQIPVITIDSKGRVTSATTTDIKEAVEDAVGALVASTQTIHAEYDDLNARLLLNVNAEELITTNISENENFKAPTSQSIKLYVDDNITAERNARISADLAIQSSIASIQTQVGANIQAQLNEIVQMLQAETAARLAAEQALAAQMNKNPITAKSETFVITQQDLTNGYVTLTSPNILENSTNAVLERVMLLENIDYSVITSNSTTSEFRFLPELPIELGETLKITYLISNSLDTDVFCRYDNFVILEEDIQRGYITLSNNGVLFESVSAFIDRTPILQGIDFVISKTPQNTVILTFIGDVLQNGPLALEAGENIRVNYLFKS